MTAEKHINRTLKPLVIQHESWEAPAAQHAGYRRATEHIRRKVNQGECKAGRPLQVLVVRMDKSWYGNAHAPRTSEQWDILWGVGWNFTEPAPTLMVAIARDPGSLGPLARRLQKLAGPGNRFSAWQGRLASNGLGSPCHAILRDPEIRPRTRKLPQGWRKHWRKRMRRCAYLNP